jgi:hypothetical protein
MMSDSNTTSSQSLGTAAQDRSDAGDSASVCLACPHRRGAHDPTGVRFCAATTNLRLDRKCICVASSTIVHY